MTDLDYYINVWKKLAGLKDSKVYPAVCAKLKSFGYRVVLHSNATVLRNTRSEIVAVHYTDC